jgi:hypothetical protein
MFLAKTIGPLTLRNGVNSKLELPICFSPKRSGHRPRWGCPSTGTEVAKLYGERWEYPVMRQIPWTTGAVIVPLGNKLGYSGTLASCLSHWQVKLSPIDQVTCFIALEEQIDGCFCLEPEQIVKLVGAFSPSGSEH